MEFELDKQTINDLEIFGNGRSPNSILNFYNQTKTIGGKSFLQHLMANPVADRNELRQRIELIQTLTGSGLDLQINSSQFDLIERYARLDRDPLKNNVIIAFFQHLSYRFRPRNDYYVIQTGIHQLIYLIVLLKEKIEAFAEEKGSSQMKNFADSLLDFIRHPDLKVIHTYNQKVSCYALNKLDNFFRKKQKKELMEVIQTVYSLDAFISVAKTAKQKNLAFPVYTETKKPYLLIRKGYHPLLDNAVPNDLEIMETTNIWFLTGPNMAGKSTFLKSIGLSVYLAHIGFPVPASEMQTSIYNGIITTINLNDDLNRGYSHFYSEVRRVKETALKLREKKKLLVIFDELFRGTNVKDAYDASLLIIESFAKIPDSTFLVSTHITEIAEKISERQNILFKFFDSKLINNVPVYEYKLENGVSHERLGMYILRNEKIIEIFDSITNN
ncbi:MAG: hypothetical protein AB2L24_20740 [Mangrovibacterium sp.]